MKRIRCVTICVALALSSCAGGNEVSGDRRVVGDAQIAFTITPGRVDVGKTVRFALKVTNNGGRTEELAFASGQLYDFWVTDGNREVWRWSDGRTFTQALQERTVATQDTATFEESWVAKGTGSFVAHGLLKAKNYEGALTGRLEIVG